jgi:hypothetical protein
MLFRASLLKINKKQKALFKKIIITKIVIKLIKVTKKKKRITLKFKNNNKITCNNKINKISRNKNIYKEVKEKEVEFKEKIIKKKKLVNNNRNKNNKKIKIKFVNR